MPGVPSESGKMKAYLTAKKLHKAAAQPTDYKEGQLDVKPKIKRTTDAVCPASSSQTSEEEEENMNVMAVQLDHSYCMQNDWTTDVNTKLRKYDCPVRGTKEWLLLQSHWL